MTHPLVLFDLFVSAIVLISAAIMTGMIRAYAIQRSLLDIPNHRSSHIVPTPKGGGLAIAVSFLFGLLVYSGWNRLDSFVLWPLALGGLMVATVGLVDDYRGHVEPGWRILVHCLAVCSGLYWLGGLPGSVVAWMPFPGIVVNILAVFSLVWLVNLFNFMDGIDGLAAMEAVSVSLAAALILSWRMGLGQAVAGLLVLFAGACLGFLIWNWPPAKIFMGDVGSGFLGYVIGMMAVLSLKSGAMPLSAWLILLAAFLVDATVTLAARMIRGERWYEAHCTHAYQSAARRYRSHKRVTVGVLAINVLWLFPLAILATARPQLGWLLVSVAWAPLVVLVLRERSLATGNAV